MENELLKLLNTAKKTQDYHDEIHINLKGHDAKDMRTDITVSPSGDKFIMTYQNKKSLLDVPDILKELSKHDVKAIYTYSEVESRNEFISELKFNSFLNKEDSEKIKDLLDEIENKSEKRVLSFKSNLDMSNNPFSTLKDKIINQYNSEPYIKYIKPSTAKAIDSLNQQHGKVLSIEELKTMYKKVGDSLENSPMKDTFDKFKELNSIISDLKQAQLRGLQDAAKEKSMDMIKTLAKSMEQSL